MISIINTTVRAFSCYTNVPSELEVREDVDDTETSSSLSSLDVLLTSTMTSFWGSV